MDIDIAVPEGQSNNWRVEKFEVSEQDAKFESMRAAFSFSSRWIKAGTYKRLMRGRTVVMSNTPAEIDDHRYFIRLAKRSGNHILINGLGLGVALTEILKSENVESVTVVEISEDVIRLVRPTFENDSRVKIVCADALTYKPEKGKRFSAVWHDIWDNICAANLPQMKTLHRRYGRICDWQGSWGRELIRR